MFKKSLILLFVAGLMLVGCIPASPYEGTWSRQALYVDGVLHPSDPATLTLGKETYSSASPTCATSGTISESDGTITMNMLESNCPGGIETLTVTYTYTIEINEEGEEVMTTVTDSIVEVYKRAE